MGGFRRNFGSIFSLFFISCILKVNLVGGLIMRKEIQISYLKGSLSFLEELSLMSKQNKRKKFQSDFGGGLNRQYAPVIPILLRLSEGVKHFLMFHLWPFMS